MRKRRTSFWRRFGLVFPALTWIVVQFAMAGGLQASPASGLLVELCAGSGKETIVINLETGEPVEQTKRSGGCDWCHSFGKAIDVPARTTLDWHEMAADFSLRLALTPPPHLVLRHVGDAHTRAPPVL